MTNSGSPPDECDLCVSDKGVYDFGRVCCLARFVCSIPVKVFRQGWMERFKSRSDEVFFDELESAVRVRWANK
jgi:hypothetical protein